MNTTTVQQPIAVACLFTWIGFVCAISFLEAWLKFRAPGVTVPIGLGIGRLVFGALKAGVSLDGLISKALEAKDNDYIPKDGADIIVHTKLIGGGESDSIEFVAPAKGSYSFLCSFPGHAMSMNGTLIVE